MGHLQDLMLRFGTRSTQFVGKYWGERFPFYYVIEYPKSGGNWLSHILAAYLGVPFLQRSVFPHGVSSVVHAHWGYEPRLRRVFYLVRDGRDVCVSAFYHARRAYLDGDGTFRAYVTRRLGKRFTAGLSVREEQAGFEAFVGVWVRRSFGTKLTWGRHVAMWSRPHKSRAIIRYEDLLTRRAAALAPALEEHTNEAVDISRLSSLFEEYSFEKMTGRQAGDADASSFRRKGIVGDWKNHFSRSTARIFDENFGDSLRSLGYENSRVWWEELPSDRP